MSEPRPSKRFGRPSFSLPRSVGNAFSKVQGTMATSPPAKEAGRSSGRASLTIGTQGSVSPADEQMTIRTRSTRKSMAGDDATLSAAPTRLSRSQTTRGVDAIRKSSSPMKSLSSMVLKPKTGMLSSALPKYKPRPSSVLMSRHAEVAFQSGGKRSLDSEVIEETSPESVGSPKYSGTNGSPRSKRCISPLPRRAVLKSVGGAVNNGSPLHSPKGIGSHNKSPRSPKKAFHSRRASALPTAKHSTSPVRSTGSPKRTLPRRMPPNNAIASPLRAGRVLAEVPKSDHGMEDATFRTLAEEEDVSFLLGAVASPSQPTPSVPRLRRINSEELQFGLSPDPSLTPMFHNRPGLFESPEAPISGESLLSARTNISLSDIPAPFGMTPEISRQNSEFMRYKRVEQDLAEDFASIDISRGSIAASSLDLSRSPTPLGGVAEKALIRPDDESSLVANLRFQLALVESKHRQEQEEHDANALVAKNRICALEQSLAEQSARQQQELAQCRTQIDVLSHQISAPQHTPRPRPAGEAWKAVQEAAATELAIVQDQRLYLATLRAVLESSQCA